MFSWASIVPAIDLSKRERPPPEFPTPARFPSYRPPQPPSSSFSTQQNDLKLTRQSSDALRSSLLRHRTPHSISPSDIERLNIHTDAHDTPIDQLVPLTYRKRPLPHDEALEAATRELSHSLDDGFGSMLRLPREESGQWPRLTSTHAFWQALEEIAQFWDDSKDDYYQVDDPEQGGDAVMGNSEDEKLNLDSSGDSTSITPVTTTAATDHPGSGSTSATRSRYPSPSKKGKKQVYRGRRSDSGARMPEETLERAARALLDIGGRAFRCHSIQKRSLLSPQAPTRLTIRGVRLPVSNHLDLGLVPADYKLARKGHIEGPVMGVHVRCQVRYREYWENVGQGKGELVDFYREVGSCLLLAQKRGREEKGGVDKRVGDDRWWGTRRRWGGGRGGNMPHESDEEPCDDVGGLVAGSGIDGAQEEGLTTKNEDGKPCSEEEQCNPRKRPGSSGTGSRTTADTDLGRSPWRSNPASIDSKDKGLAANADTIEVDPTEEATSIEGAPTTSRLPARNSSPRSSKTDPDQDADDDGHNTSPAHEKTGPEYKRVLDLNESPFNIADLVSKSGRMSPNTSIENLESNDPNKSKTDSTTNKKNHTPRYLRMMEDYRSLKPAAPTHDERIKYRRIGMVRDKERRPACEEGSGGVCAEPPLRTGEGEGGEESGKWDEIFILSAVNHHVALLRMRVHEDYLSWLECGETGQINELPSSHDFYAYLRPDTLYLQRTRWFDLLKAEDRVEVCVGLWAVLGWMLREEDFALGGANSISR